MAGRRFSPASAPIGLLSQPCRQLGVIVRHLLLSPFLLRHVPRRTRDTAILLLLGITLLLRCFVFFSGFLVSRPLLHHVFGIALLFLGCLVFFL